MPLSLKDCEADVAAIIEAALIPGVSFAGNSLFAGPLPDGAADVAVACRWANSEAEPYVSFAAALFRAEVQVMVRGAINEYATTLTLARTCFEVLWLPVAVDYVSIESDGAGPTYMGPDENGRPVFVFNVACTFTAEKGVTAPPVGPPLSLGVLY